MTNDLKTTSFISENCDSITEDNPQPCCEKFSIKPLSLYHCTEGKVCPEASPNPGQLFSQLLVSKDICGTIRQKR